MNQVVHRFEENRTYEVEVDRPVSPSEPLMPSDLIHDILFCCCPQSVLVSFCNSRYTPFIRVLQKSANVVAYLSLLLLAINLISLLMSSTSDTMSFMIDLGIFVVEFLSIVSLLYGISNKAANYLRPYLIFGVSSAHEPINPFQYSSHLSDHLEFIPFRFVDILRAQALAQSGGVCTKGSMEHFHKHRRYARRHGSIK